MRLFLGILIVSSLLATNLNGQNGQNSTGSLVISNFEIDDQLYEGNPEIPSSMNPVVGETLTSNREFVIQYDHQFDNIPLAGIQQQPGGLRNGFFHFSFELTSVPAGVTELSYIIFYQNKTYSFPNSNPRNSENFYGAWGWDEDDRPGLRTVSVTSPGTQVVNDYFRIRGNPRNEDRYCNSCLDCVGVGCLSCVNDCGGWVDNNYSSFSSGDGKRQRWKRLPRMGEYEFLLIVTLYSEGNFPGQTYLINPSGLDSNGDLKSPFHWKDILINSEDILLENTAVVEPANTITVKTDIHEVAMEAPIEPNADEPRSPFRRSGGNSGATSELRKKIPLQRDIDTWTQLDYNWHTHFFHEEDLIDVIYNVDSNQDNENVEALDSSIFLRIPPADNCMESPVKLEYASLQLRHGMTYGKYTIEMQFPKIYNPNGISRLIGSTFWFTQFQEEPAMRYFCNSLGKHIDFDFNIEATPSAPEPYGSYYGDPSLYPELVQFLPSETKQFNIADWNTYTDLLPLEERDKIEILMSYSDDGCGDVDLDPIGGESFLLDVVPPENGFLDLQQIRLGVAGEGNNGFKTNYVYNRNIPGEENTIIDAEIDDDDIFRDDPRESYFYQFEWTVDGIYFRMGPSLGDLVLVSYITDEYMTIPNVPLTMLIDLRYWSRGAVPWYRHGSQFIPFHTRPISGRLKRVIIE